MICALIVIIIAILTPILFLLYLELTSPEPPTTTGTTLKNREAIVLKDIKPEDISGKVRVIKSSRVWSATAERKIKEGTKVKIIDVEGVHVKVESLVEPEEEMDIPEPPEELQEWEEVPEPKEEVIGEEIPEIEEEWKEKVPESEEVIGEEIPEIEEEGWKEKVPEPEEVIGEEIPEIEGEGWKEEVPEPEEAIGEEIPEIEEVPEWEEVPEPKEEIPELEEEMPEPEEEIIESEEVIGPEIDLGESEVCPSCETVITVYVEQCPICGEELVKDEDIEEKGFFRSFNKMFGSLRGG